MTENLLQKLEEKVMILLSEVEDLRKEIQYLKYENGTLRTEKEKYVQEKGSHERKLHDLISLLDAVNVAEVMENANIAA